MAGFERGRVDEDEAGTQPRGREHGVATRPDNVPRTLGPAPGPRLGGDCALARPEPEGALSTWPAKPYENVFHPDGTGLTEQHFIAYFDERYMKRKKDQKKPEPAFVGSPKPEPKPRLHHWTYVEILWTYRYTLIAAIHTQQGPFGEAP